MSDGPKIEVDVKILEQLKPGDMLLVRVPVDTELRQYRFVQEYLTRALQKMGLEGKVPILLAARDYDVDRIKHGNAKKLLLQVLKSVEDKDPVWSAVASVFVTRCSISWLRPLKRFRCKLPASDSEARTPTVCRKAFKAGRISPAFFSSSFKSLIS